MNEETDKGILKSLHNEMIITIITIILLFDESKKNTKLSRKENDRKETKKKTMI